MKLLKCCKIKIIGLLIGLFSSSSSIATETLEGPLACDFSAEESRMVTLKITNGDIEGAVMRLPRDYIIGVSYSGNNAVHKTGFFRAYTTDFRPYPNRELHLKDGRSKISVGIDDKINILISNNWRPEILARRTISSQYKKLRFNDPNTDIEGSLAEYGLYKPNHEIKPSGMEVSLGKQNGKITDVIRCSQVSKNSRFPQCSHLFEAGAYDVEISYAKTQLSRWKELRQNTDKLLQCFTVQEPKQIEGK